MRTVPFSELANEVSRLMGWDPDNLDAAEFDIIRGGVNRGLAEHARRVGAVGLMRCEERRFRDDYDPALTYAALDEVYHVGSDAYYVALPETVPINQAPATYSGGVWTVNDGYWAECARSYGAVEDYDDATTYAVTDRVRWQEDGHVWQLHTAAVAGTDPDDADRWGRLPAFDAYVPAVQSGQTSIGRVRGVFAQNPRLYAGAPAIPWARSEHGVEVFTELTSVWVEYEMRPHRFIGAAWSASASYTPAEGEDATGTTITVASSASLNGFPSRTLAKASLLLVNGHYYYVGSGDSGFLSGWFLYDADSAATADDSDTLLAALGGRLLRQT